MRDPFVIGHIRKVLKEINANAERVTMMTAVEYRGSGEVPLTEFTFLVKGTRKEIAEKLDED